MKCPLCGHFFEPDQAETCGGCSLRLGCHMVRCPRCGYESPQEPGLVRFIKSWMGKRHETG